MAETTTPPPDVDLVADESSPLPFLRINGNYPVDGGRYETISLEMNLGPDDQVAEPDPDTGGIKSWFTDFVTQVIGSLRQAPFPQTVVLTGASVQSFLGDRMRHADDCAGDCGQPPQPEPGGDAGERERHRQRIVDRAYGSGFPVGQADLAEPADPATDAAGSQSDCPCVGEPAGAGDELKAGGA